MRTIKEMADEYMYNRDPYLDEWTTAEVREAYMQGAEDEREELTRWRDPKESLPEYYKSVMITFRKSGLIRMAVAWLSAGDAGEYSWTIDGTNVLVNEKKVVGWRPIHE